MAAFLAVFSSGLVQLYVAPDASAAPKEQVTFCHSTGSDTWVTITAAPEVVFNSGHDEHQDGRDILPAFEYKKQGEVLKFDGLNYDDRGKAILDNGCVLPQTVEPVSPAVTQPTCEAPYGVLNLTDSTLYKYQINGVDVVNGAQLEAGTTVAVSAIALTTGTVFPSYATSYAFPALVVKSVPTDCEEVAVPEISVSGLVCDSAKTGITNGKAVIRASGLDSALAYSWSLSRDGVVVKTGKLGVQTDGTAGVSWSDLANGSYDFVVKVSGEIVMTAGFSIENCPNEQIVNPRANHLIICGPNNDVISDTGGEHIAVQGEWVNGKKIVTYTANPGYTFAEGSIHIKTFTDNATPCEEDVPALPETPTEGVCEQIVTGRTIWKAGASDITNRDKYGEGAEVNADGFGDTLRLYAATDNALRDVTITFTATQGFSFAGGVYNTLSMPGAGMLKTSGYVNAPVGLTVTFQDGKYIVHIDSMPAKSSFSFNAPIVKTANATLYMDSIMSGSLVECGEPGRGGDNGGQIGSGVTTTAILDTPAVLPATGPTENINFLVLGFFATLFSYGAAYFAQPRRETTR